MENVQELRIIIMIGLNKIEALLSVIQKMLTGTGANANWHVGIRPAI